MRNRPQRNNNPLNIRFAKQREAIGRDLQDFAIFPTPEAGIRAGIHQIQLYQSRGLSLGEAISTFAPPSENDTEKYIAFICEELRTDGERPLAELSALALFGVMMQYEGYTAEEK